MNEDENPKARFGILKDCFSNIPAAALLKVIETMNILKKDAVENNDIIVEDKISSYFNVILQQLIAFYDCNVISVKTNNKENSHNSLLYIACTLIILMEKILRNEIKDDRPKPVSLDLQEIYNAQSELLKKYPEPAEKVVNKNASIDNLSKEIQGILNFADFPMDVIVHVEVAMQEGAFKYGAQNYRNEDQKIAISTYYNACIRHLFQFFYWGQNIDVESKAHHVVKAIAGILILIDTIINNCYKDDRPIPSKLTFVNKFVL